MTKPYRAPLTWKRLEKPIYGITYHFPLPFLVIFSFSFTIVIERNWDEWGRSGTIWDKHVATSHQIFYAFRMKWLFCWLIWKSGKASNLFSYSLHYYYYYQYILHHAYHSFIVCSHQIDLLLSETLNTKNRKIWDWRCAMMFSICQFVVQKQSKSQLNQCRNSLIDFEIVQHKLDTVVVDE